MDLTNISKYGITDGEWENYIKAVNEWVIKKAKGTTDIDSIDKLPIVHVVNEKVKNYTEVYGNE